MKDMLRRAYWVILASVSLILAYEAFAEKVYGDNSFWLAMVFFGVAALSLVRSKSMRR